MAPTPTKWPQFNDLKLIHHKVFMGPYSPDEDRLRATISVSNPTYKTTDPRTWVIVRGQTVNQYINSAAEGQILMLRHKPNLGNVPTGVAYPCYFMKCCMDRSLNHTEDYKSPKVVKDVDII